MSLKKFINNIFSLYGQNCETNTKQNILRSVKPRPIQWSSSTNPSRRDEAIITRLRIGHTSLIHSHLISQPLPNYPHCHDISLSVDHLFTDPATKRYHSCLQIPSSRSEVLSNLTTTIFHVLQFLHTINIYHFI